MRYIPVLECRQPLFRQHRPIGRCFSVNLTNISDQDVLDDTQTGIKIVFTGIWQDLQLLKSHVFYLMHTENLCLILGYDLQTK
jgi:hypothetical protein